MKGQQHALGILIFSFIVVLSWTGVHFYGIYTESTISSTLQTQIIPITPVFDKGALRTLTKRNTIAPQYAPVGSVSAEITPIPSPLKGFPTPQQSINLAPSIVLPQLNTSVGTAGGQFR